MDYCSWYYFLTSLFYATIIIADNRDIQTIDVQQNERIQLECTMTSRLDAEEAMWMRIRPPHNPDILTYRDSVVYAPDRIQLEQRRLSSSVNTNGTLIDTYFSKLVILRPNTDDEGRYICSRGKNVFAEYDLFIIVPPRFVDDDSFIQQRTIIEGSTLELSCSADARPKPFITWLYRSSDGRHIPFGDGSSCQDKVCKLYLENYSRNDPTTIECVADNEKSTRISRIFNVDVHFSPQLTITTQATTSSRGVEVLLYCFFISNPPASVMWLDSNRLLVQNSDAYNIRTTNHSSTLSIALYRRRYHPQAVYYCKGNNSIGIDEKPINISNFIELDATINRETTTKTTTTKHSLPTSSMVDDFTDFKKLKAKPSRARSHPPAAVKQTNDTIVPSSSNTIYSFSNTSFYLILSLLVICFV